MTGSNGDFERLALELWALMNAYGKAQSRCSELIARQAAEIERLRANEMRLRGSFIARESALAWEREDRHKLEASIPGLPARVALANQIGVLTAKLQVLARAKSDMLTTPPEVNIDAVAADKCEDLASSHPRLEASLVAADLVICQTGCLGHSAYWRVQDYCRRTGKACVVIDEPSEVRIVRIHRRSDSVATEMPGDHEA